MSSTRYDRIIDRYINGQMKPAEEEDFRKLLELDDELRRLFEADQRMSATLLKERGALASLDHPESYSRFLMGLAASVPSGGELSGTASPGSVAATSASSMAPLLAGGLGLVLAVTISFFWLSDTMVKAPTAQHGDTTGAHGTTHTPPLVIEPPLPAPMPGAETTDTIAPANAANGGDTPAVPNARETRPARETVTEPLLPSAEPARPKARSERRRDDIPTFVDDTIRTRLKVERSDR